MDKINKIFLDIIKCAINGKKAEINEDISSENWQQLFILAEKHSLLPLFYEAVYTLPSLKRLDSPFVFAAKKKVMNQVLMQTIRTNEFLFLYEEFCKKGIYPIVVKGIICRSLYSMPDHRPSSDEDVLIPYDRFDECHQIMLSNGMYTAENEEEIKSSYEVPYRKNGSPMYIELHKHLFPPESDAYGDLNRFFTGVFERSVKENIQGTFVYSMDYTDHLFYLICHAFKHFLHSGFGIRQVCDIVMYANKYGKEIDWLLVYDNCSAINALYFTKAIFNIGEKYLSFSREKSNFSEEWQSIETDESDMLSDLLSGGLYGSADMSRKHSSSITLDAVAANKKGKKVKNSVILSLFPSPEKLKSRYPYLKKHPYLLPAAWVQRIVKYSKETRNVNNNNAAESLKIGSERIELMKKYGIIK